MANSWQEVVKLEAALVDLGRHLEYPSTPQLASRVLPSLRARPQGSPLWQRLLHNPLRVAVASLMVVLFGLIGILAFSPEVRTAVAERIGLRGAPIEQVSRPPTATAGAGLDLGERTTLDEARILLPLALPATIELGEPDAVYFAPTPLGGTVSLVYGSRPRLTEAAETGVSLLMLESRLPPDGFQPAVLRKGAGPDTRVQELSVNGGRGVWLEGAPHLLYLPDARGRFSQDRVRLTANVLLWEQSGLLLRFEGSLSRDQALQIAGSVH